MYICPHRSWSDFFVHRRIVDGHGSNLSRWMVLAAFPLFYVVTAFDRSVFWFNRSVSTSHPFEDCNIKLKIISNDKTESKRKFQRILCMVKDRT